MNDQTTFIKEDDMTAFGVSIEQVVDLLGLERKPGNTRGNSFDVKCPFCGDTGYHMNINVAKNAYHCVRCMDAADKGTGVLDLYGRVAFGTPAVPGQNTKELYGKLMDALGQSGTGKYTYDTEENKYEEIYPAIDSILDRAYTALFRLPYLKLSEEHRQALYNRGLDDREIGINGYATMYPSAELLSGLSDRQDVAAIRERYKADGLTELKTQTGVLKTYSDDDIVLGILIAGDVIAQGISVENVPGFYRIGGLWAFRGVDPGMLIPTRNSAGQIVAVQTRRDTTTEKNSLRYMTVSSKGLDGGVTTGISRTHFPLASSIICPDTTVILTEGPLKADVAISMMHRLGKENIAFVAVQGVTNTREIPEIAGKLAACGVTEVLDGFDADKLVNPYVQKALQTAQRMFEEAGIKLIPLYWDEEYISLKFKTLVGICADNGVMMDLGPDIYGNIIQISKDLSEKGIDYDYILNKDGNMICGRWNPETKGIDDYLHGIAASVQ